MGYSFMCLHAQAKKWSCCMYVVNLALLKCVIYMHTHIDELAMAMKATRGMKMIDEMIPVSYKEFQQRVIHAGTNIFTKGEDFPILKYQDFE